MEVTAITRNVRLSAMKGRPLARKVQGMAVSEALKVTQFSPRKAAVALGQTIQSAVANAVSNHNLDANSLRVQMAVFDEGPRMRRFRPRARGSASPILKRMCHVKVVLTDGQSRP